MSYTPSNILGSTGLLQNQGFDLSLISGICYYYNTRDLPLAYRSAVNAAVAADAAVAEANGNLSTNYTGIVTNVGADKLPGLLGLTPTSPNYVPYIGGSGLANAAVAQAQLIFPSNDISALIQNLSRCSGVASITGELFRTSKLITDQPIRNFGPMEKYTDLVTAGLGRLSKTSDDGSSLVTNVVATGTELQKLGTAISLELAKEESLENERQQNEEVREVSKAPINQFDAQYGPENVYDGPTVEVSTPDGSTIVTVPTGKYLDQAPRSALPSINNPVDFASRMLRQGGGDIGKLSAKVIGAFFDIRNLSEKLSYTSTKRSAALLVAAELTGDGSLLVLAENVTTTQDLGDVIHGSLVIAAKQSTSDSVQAALNAVAAQGDSNEIHTGLQGLTSFERKTIDNELANKLDSLRSNKFAQSKVNSILTEIDNSADIQRTKELFGMGRTLRGGLLSFGVGGIVKTPATLRDDDPSSITIRRLIDIPNFDTSIPEIKAVVDSEAMKDIGGILNQLSGTTNVNSFADVGNILSQFEDAPSSPILDARSTFYNVSELNSLKNYIPLFDNDEVGPTVADMVGVVAGGPVGTAIENAAKGIVKSLQTTEGQNILSNLEAITSTMQGANVEVDESATISAYVANINSNMTSLLLSSNGYKQEVVALAGTGYVNGCRLLTNQKTSLARFDIDLTQVSFGAKIPLISFGRSIGDIAKDPAMEAILVNLCSNNKYGEALKLHITEKRNIAIMQQFGINPDTLLQIPKVDPDLFSF